MSHDAPETKEDRAAPTARSAVIVDHFPVVLDAITDLISRHRIAETVASADTAIAALDQCVRLGRDLVITDVDLGRTREGIWLCRRLKQLPRPPSVLMYSSTKDASAIVECICSGADSFVHRSASPGVVVSALREMLAARSSWFFGDDGRSPVESVALDRRAVDILTERERQVLALLLRRYSNHEIAADLFLARQTVKNYVSNVLQKLGFASRGELLLMHSVSAK
jgi:DNA-binding NarL/FixJ family response regulator